MSTERARFRRLDIRGRESRDLASPGIRERERHVPEAADADHADAVGRLDAERTKRREDRDAAADTDLQPS